MWDTQEPAEGLPWCGPSLCTPPPPPWSFSGHTTDLHPSAWRVPGTSASRASSYLSIDFLGPLATSTGRARQEQFIMRWLAMVLQFTGNLV